VTAGATPKITHLDPKRVFIFLMLIIENNLFIALNRFIVPFL